MNQESLDMSPVRVTREIPLWGLISTCVAIAVQAIMMWVAQQTQSEALRGLTAEMKELRKEMAAGGVELTKLTIQMGDHERRIAALERAKP